jgi:signal transduction histidine kinase
MPATTKILIVENDPGDVELLQRQLKKADFAYNSEVVKTEKGYISALKIFAPDVILSDFVLPSFSGDAAFKIREQIAPETPFIFVSGTIGEEKAVEYIKSGVTDYVMKDKLFTVIIKIKRALRDVKEKQQKNKAEAEREKLIQDLQLRNNELEQFAYVASHDLQEPLRMISSFMGRLENKYGDVVDDRGKQYIHFAVDGAKRMREIILDLLNFSKVGKTDEDLQEVNFTSLINEILALYRNCIKKVKGAIAFENLPTFQTYKAPVSQVFQNLISNALKYHKPNEAPIIAISYIETTTLFQFSVKDNGIGISPEYFEKIFIIFRRLHNKDEYSGTGMGLAIVKKIIENLGGKIWVESEEGVGSTFHFTLIKKQ